MSPFVVDASVAAKWLLEEKHSDAAGRLRAYPSELHAPDFVQIELANVVAKHERRGLLSATEASATAELLRVLPLQPYAWQGLLGSAFDLALETKRDPLGPGVEGRVEFEEDRLDAVPEFVGDMPDRRQGLVLWAAFHRGRLR